MGGKHLLQELAAPVCAFTFPIFVSKIEADVRSGHGMAAPARFAVLYFGWILIRTLCIAKLSWARHKRYTAATGRTTAQSRVAAWTRSPV
jgi:hypothetical protein